MDSSIQELADSFSRLANAQLLVSFYEPVTVPQALPTSREPKIQLPPRYDAESQCQIVYRAQPSRFQSEDSRVTLILSLLTGPTLEWAVPLILSQAPVLNYYTNIMKETEFVFDHRISGKDAAMSLTGICQGARSVVEFCIQFRSLAGETGWPEGPLSTLFTNALHEPVKDALAAMGAPDTFDALVSIAIRIDNRLRE